MAPFQLAETAIFLVGAPALCGLAYPWLRRRYGWPRALTARRVRPATHPELTGPTGRMTFAGLLIGTILIGRESCWRPE